MERDLRADLSPCPLFHIELCTAVTFPVHRLRAVLIGQCINVHFICYHKRRIKSQTKMSYDLILVRLVLILLYKIRGTGKSDLIDILFHLACRHADAVINKF